MYKERERQISFKELAYVIVGASKLETQRRVYVFIVSLKAVWRQKKIEVASLFLRRPSTDWIRPAHIIKDTSPYNMEYYESE